MTPRNDRQAHDEMVRHAAHAATDVGMDDRHSWLAEFNKPVQAHHIGMAVFAVCAWAGLFWMVIAEVCR